MQASPACMSTAWSTAFDHPTLSGMMRFGVATDWLFTPQNYVKFHITASNEYGEIYTQNVKKNNEKTLNESQGLCCLNKCSRIEQHIQGNKILEEVNFNLSCTMPMDSGKWDNKFLIEVLQLWSMRKNFGSINKE